MKVTDPVGQQTNRA